MCEHRHWYTIEVVGQPIRYAGSDREAAIGALLTIDIDSDEEGYAVAEYTVIEPGTFGAITGSEYCPAESKQIEIEAIVARSIEHHAEHLNELPRSRPPASASGSTP